MATKRELDAMLDNLKSGNKPKKPIEKKPEKADKATIDALINTINKENREKAAASENNKVRTDSPIESTRVFDKKPVSEYERKFGKKIKPLTDAPAERPVYQSDDEPTPVKKKKMKIVISGELPDYEALRQQELAKDRAAAGGTEKSGETAADNAKAAEKKRIADEMAAEKKRIAEAKAAEEAEKAEKKRIAEEMAAEKKRIAEEKNAKSQKKRAAEEKAASEKKRRTEEKTQPEKKQTVENKFNEEEQLSAEQKRIAEIKAEKKRRIAEAKARLAEEAARLEAEEAEAEAEAELAEETAETAPETETAETFEEEAELTDEETADEIDADAEETAEEAEDELERAANGLSAAAMKYEPDDSYVTKIRPAPKHEFKKKKGLFAKIKSMLSGDVFDEAEQDKYEQMSASAKHTEDPDFSRKPKKPVVDDEIEETAEEDIEPETETENDDLFEQTAEDNSEQLVEDAMAAINGEEEVSEPEPEIEEEPAAEKFTFEESVSDVKYTDELDDEFEAKLDEVISEAEEVAADGLDISAAVEAVDDSADEDMFEFEAESEDDDEEISDDEEFGFEAESEDEEEEFEFEAESEDEEDDEEPAADEDEEKPENSGKAVSVLEDILDEDPDEIISATREKAAKSRKPKAAVNFKAKKKYAVIGVICAVFAVIGIASVLVAGIKAIRNIGNADDKKAVFTDIIYPVTIMDIGAFDEPVQLTSEQVITATIWSVIMDNDKISKYDSQLGDTISIPDVDIEKYAVELFGDALPEFEHCTVGPVESRFYYSNGAYNVKLRPITFTYAPDVRSVVKSGDEYTLTVDYIDELPEWMPKSVAKTVEFKVTERDDGTFKIDSMRIISVKSSNL